MKLEATIMEAVKAKASTGTTAYEIAKAEGVDYDTLNAEVTKLCEAGRLFKRRNGWINLSDSESAKNAAAHAEIESKQAADLNERRTEAMKKNQPLRVPNAVKSALASDKEAKDKKAKARAAKASKKAAK